MNTAAWRLRSPSEERLPDAEALLGWLSRNGIGSAECFAGMLSDWRVDPELGRKAYEAAIGLREAIYVILLAGIAGGAPPDGALRLFNELLALSTSRAELAWRAGALLWIFRPQSHGLELLKPILVSAAELMTGPRRRRVKQCQDDRGCGWLFVDDSRANNRRWCSMGDCGNRAKAQRHYQKVRRRESGA